MRVDNILLVAICTAAVVVNQMVQSLAGDYEALLAGTNPSERMLRG